MKFNLLSILFFITNFIIAQNNISAEIIYSSYFGGNEGDEARSIAIDKDDNFYIFGYTLSTDLPTSSNSFQDTLKGSYDAFISKFDSSGNHIWTTYIGGTNVDIASGIKATNDNYLVLLGYTNSIDFPTTSGAYQTTNAGQYDVFLIKIDTGGNLVWSTLFGGIGGELGIDISIDLNNNIIIGGQTNSSNFPSTTGAFQPLPLGGNDAFIAKFNQNGHLLWATCYGGTSTEDAHAITSDFENNIIITGMTNSNDLSISSNALQSLNNGFFDIYIAKFSPTGNLLWATYFGGTNYDDIYGIHSDSSSNLYLAGRTSSVDFVTTPNAFQTSKNNGVDACIFKLSKNGELAWSTYLGGDGDDFADKILIDKNNNVTTLINTLSDTISLPADTIFTNYPLNLEKAYILTLDSSGVPIWSAYFGGNSIDRAYDFKIVPSGKLFFTGTTESANIPITANAFQNNKDLYVDSYFCIINSSIFYTDTSNINTITRNNLVQNNISLYPNPTHNTICVENVMKPFYYAIINTKGEIIKSEICNNNCIETNYLSSGLYIIEILNNEQIYRKKIIKQ
ncbi:MAG: SBBP repeat-containing protein [Bacteroidia bacterium]